jgi:hypothetical protein
MIQSNSLFSKVITALFGGVILFFGWGAYPGGVNSNSNLPAKSLMRQDNELSTISPCPTTWEEVPMPTGQTILSADFVNSDDGWAVGLGGIFRWQNGKWTFYSNPPNIRLNFVKMLSSTDGWIVGSAGSIYHWDGQAWQKFPSPMKDDLISLSFISPDQGWAAGGIYIPDIQANGGGKGERITLEWNGKTWKVKSNSGFGLLPYGEFNLIAMNSSTSGWAAGDGDILQLNGLKWHSYHLKDNDESHFTFTSISNINSENAWMAGNDFYFDTGELFHWDGSQWSAVKKVQYDLNSISMPDSDFGLAGGGRDYEPNNASLLLCWDGQEWTEIKSPTTYPIQLIWAKSPKEIWVFSGNYSGLGLGEVFRAITLQTQTESPTTTSTSSILPTLTPTIGIPAGMPQVPTPGAMTITPAINPSAKEQTPSYNPYFLVFGFFILLALIAYLFFRLKHRT